MDDTERGLWWHVRPAGDRVELSHGPTVNGRPETAHAVVLTSLPAALDLAVGIVHACLEIDSEQTQVLMLELWFEEQ